MKNKYSFISVLTSDDYLPGLLVLFDSLKNTNTDYPFITLMTPNISSRTLSTVSKYEIPYKVLEQEIPNPTDISGQHRWFSTYSKIFIFNQTQYGKVVYLDVDMLVLKNIDELFEKLHMSAVSSGSMLPRKKSQTYLNSGLMIIKPSRKLFKEMVNKIGEIEKVESGGTTTTPYCGSDQDFLNAFYPNWPKDKKLHLDHKYNIFHYHLDEYSNLFGYSIHKKERPISIIHFASYLKPWNINREEFKKLQEGTKTRLESDAIKLWRKKYHALLKNVAK